MAVAFVYCVILRRDRWVDVPVELLDVRHASITHCFSQTINYTAQSNKINAYRRTNTFQTSEIIGLYMSHFTVQLSLKPRKEVGEIRVR